MCFLCNSEFVTHVKVGKFSRNWNFNCITATPRRPHECMTASMTKIWLIIHIQPFHLSGHGLVSLQSDRQRSKLMHLWIKHLSAPPNKSSAIYHSLHLRIAQAASSGLCVRSCTWCGFKSRPWQSWLLKQHALPVCHDSYEIRNVLPSSGSSNDEASAQVKTASVISTQSH